MSGQPIQICHMLKAVFQIRIQVGLWTRIQIWESKSRKAKTAHKKYKKVKKSKSWN